MMDSFPGYAAFKVLSLRDILIVRISNERKNFLVIWFNFNQLKRFSTL